MPTITITLTDTPEGAVAVHSDFKPAVGTPCSPAQAAALDIIARTTREYMQASDSTQKFTSLDAAINAIRAQKENMILKAAHFHGLNDPTTYQDGASANEIATRVAAHMSGFISAIDWLARELFYAMQRDEKLDDKSTPTEGLYLIEAALIEAKSCTQTIVKQIESTKH